MSIITALSFLTTVSSMILSKCLMNVKYSFIHFFGMAISIIGLFLTIISDFLQNDIEQNFTLKNMILGTIMAAVCQICYAGYIFYMTIIRSNVFQEKIILSGDSIYHCLGYEGVIGTLISITQAGLLKEYKYFNLLRKDHNIFYLLGFIGLNIGVYEMIPAFLFRNAATLFSLSLLSGPFYASFLQHWLFGLKNVLFIYFNISDIYFTMLEFF